MSRGEEDLPLNGTGAIRYLIIDDVHVVDVEIARVRLHRFMQSIEAAGLRVHIAGDSFRPPMHREDLLAARRERDQAAWADTYYQAPAPDYPSRRSIEEAEKSPVRPKACDFARRYQGLRPPTCWKGRGCASCVQKFKEKQSRGASGRGKGERR